MRYAEQMQEAAPLILRVGMGLVFLWFGCGQVSDPSSWQGYLPEWTSSLPISATTFILLNGWFECVFSLLLICGFASRSVALLLSLHLYGIAASFGFSAVGVRDFGLATATLSLSLSGPGRWSLDSLLNKK